MGQLLCYRKDNKDAYTSAAVYVQQFIYMGLLLCYRKERIIQYSALTPLLLKWLKGHKSTPGKNAQC